MKRYRRYRKRAIRRRVRKMVRFSPATQTYNAILMSYQSVGLTAAAGGGYQDLAYCFPLNFPLRYVATSSTFGLVPNIPPNYDRLRLTFNQYRTVKFEVRVIPDGLDTKTNSAIPDLSDAPSVVYVYKDAEDYKVPSSETEMMQAGTNPVQFTYNKVLKYTYKNPDKTWMSFRDIDITPTTALSAETDMSGPDTFRSLKMYFPRLQFAAAGGSTYYYGRLYTKWYVQCRGIRIASA